MGKSHFLGIFKDQGSVGVFALRSFRVVKFVGFKIFFEVVNLVEIKFSKIIKVVRIVNFAE